MGRDRVQIDVQDTNNAKNRSFEGPSAADPPANDVVTNLVPRGGREPPSGKLEASEVEATDVAEIRPENWTEIPRDVFVTRFIFWVHEHGLHGPWTSDDVWFLASEDFAPAHDLHPPPQREFLRLLKRALGVHVRKDKRVRDRHGNVKRKATFYTLPSQSFGADDQSGNERN